MAQAYTGGGSLYDVLHTVTAAMPRFVEVKNGIYVVSNPVQPKGTSQTGGAAILSGRTGSSTGLSTPRPTSPASAKPAASTASSRRWPRPSGTGPPSTRNGPRAPGYSRAGAAAGWPWSPAPGRWPRRAAGPSATTPSTAQAAVPARERTLIEQAFQLDRDFPDGKAKLRPTVLVWTGTLTPTPLSREYTVRIRYTRGHYPGVRLVEPRLQPDERELLLDVSRTHTERPVLHAGDRRSHGR